MDNKLNIYEKVAVLQDKIKVNKGNRNNFADFSYRTIQDIFSELKPLLKELNLIINFGSGTLDGDKYSLEMRVIDIKDLESKIVETGEIYIDRTKAKMDLSQKCLSAKTFLKKSLLEDLLLINEDDDPDGHDNTGKQNNTTKPKGNKNSGSTGNTTTKKQTPEEIKQVSKLKNILYFAADKDNNKMLQLLEQNTAFKGRDGKQVAGLDSFDKLNGKRLEVTLSKIEQLYPDIVKTVEAKNKK